ncbi:FxDxF family PEP-CTERM protein [Xylophilus sp. GOD-11R]|uniref:FxDxF family PEP-CTERM protein n=1 Tax=Xylophilus sp. GOD-11R TaxID=3089814 RepID=UPI00298C1E44|nr:FxDxF family PEP-CTERM protein [Xylophilus sp. GOD-11R]WPB59442.1 FxDxF family PEP-CTERM protein [Xylophilus sp. GOD-11R]
MFKKASIVAAMALCLATGGEAMATPAAINLGPVSGTVTIEGVGSNGFDHLFNFQIGSLNLSTVVTTLSITLTGSNAVVTGLQLFNGKTLFSESLNYANQVTGEANFENTELATGVIRYDGTLATGPLTFGADYTLRVIGTGSGTYTGLLAINPVPEPETYALMIAGLGMMAAIARRRRSIG